MSLRLPPWLSSQGSPSCPHCGSPPRRGGGAAEEQQLLEALYPHLRPSSPRAAERIYITISLLAIAAAAAMAVYFGSAG